ncbi:MAG TPA: hypothetical protein VFE20_03520 [Thermoleophilia bacterium]|nr:hypothetical protein [Thermoleophilia bacterium]
MRRILTTLALALILMVAVVAAVQASPSAPPEPEPVPVGQTVDYCDLVEGGGPVGTEVTLYGWVKRVEDDFVFVNPFRCEDDSLVKVETDNSELYEGDLVEATGVFAGVNAGGNPAIEDAVVGPAL